MILLQNQNQKPKIKDEKQKKGGFCLCCNLGLNQIQNSEESNTRNHLVHFFGFSCVSICSTHCECRVMEQLIIKACGQDPSKLKNMEGVFQKYYMRSSWKFVKKKSADQHKCSMIYGLEVEKLLNNMSWIDKIEKSESDIALIKKMVTNFKICRAYLHFDTKSFDKANCSSMQDNLTKFHNSIVSYCGSEGLNYYSLYGETSCRNT